MSAAIFRVGSLCVFSCYASVSKRKNVKVMSFTSYSCHLTIFFRYVDIRG
jgi:hypothetical protein